MSGGVISGLSWQQGCQSSRPLVGGTMQRSQPGSFRRRSGTRTDPIQVGKPAGSVPGLFEPVFARARARLGRFGGLEPGASQGNRIWNSHRAAFGAQWDDEPPRLHGAKNSGDRVTDSGRPHMASWRFVRPPNADPPTSGWHVVGADSVSLSRKFQMRFPCGASSHGLQPARCNGTASADEQG
jgi:hypothetical protein